MLYEYKMSRRECIKMIEESDLDVDYKKLTMTELKNICSTIPEKKMVSKIIDKYEVDEFTSDDEEYSDDEVEEKVEKVEKVTFKKVEVPVKNVEVVFPVEEPETVHNVSEDEDFEEEYKEEGIVHDRITLRKAAPKLNIKLFERECLNSLRKHKDNVKDILKLFSGKLDDQDREDLTTDYNIEREAVEDELEMIDNILSDNNAKLSAAFNKKINRILEREMDRVKSKLL